MFCHHFNPDLCSTALQEHGSRGTSLTLENPPNYRRTTVMVLAHGCTQDTAGSPSVPAEAQESAAAVRSNHASDSSFL